MPDSEDPNSYPLDIGLDLQYNITPGLRAALTVNTDFAEVEVDQRRVNLTRFPLYFPEKRDFFLEGSGVYDFAIRNAAYPYFSRRIGLTDNGEPVPITFGLRFGGQLGAYELGFIQVRTGRYQESGSEDFTIARIKRRLFKESSIGAIYTRRAAAGFKDTANPADNHTIGLDLDLKTSRFMGDKNFQFEAFFVWHTDPFVGGFTDFGDFSCRGVRVNFPNDLWRAHTSYREFGVGYDPAVGFKMRTGIRRLNPGIWYSPRPKRIPFIRQLEFGVNHLSLWNISSNYIESQATSVSLLGIYFESSDSFNLSVSDSFERLEEPFTIHEDIIIPVGEYRALTWSWGLSSARHRTISGSIFFSHGGFWSGHRKSYQVDLDVKPFPGVSLAAQFEKNDVDLSEGNFSTHLVRLIGEWHINPKFSLLGYLQYDDVSDILGFFWRLRWIIRPGSDLYFVYTHNWAYDPAGLNRFTLDTISRAAALKVNYTYRF
jgi:hypothetical protein